MIVIMLINITTCFYVIMNYGFTDFKISKFLIFKKTFNLLLGNYHDIEMGYGDDDFADNYETV